MNSETAKLDSTTLDLATVQLRAKDGLRFAVRQRRDTIWYLVEDPSNGKFFRLGIAEAALLSMLDGQRTLQEALQELAKFQSGLVIDESWAAQAIQHLIRNGLIHSDSSRSHSRIESNRAAARSAARIQRLNPIALSIPLFNPSRLISAIDRCCGHLLGWPLMIIGSALILFASIKLWMHWDELTLYRLQAYSATDWLWFVLSWLLVKSLHELGHGLVCKRFGGDVTQAGIVLLLFIPLPFVDVTSAWAFSQRRHRMAVAAAGMFFELLIAAAALIWWSELEPGPLKFHLEDIILAASVHTLLFNLNPLMRFDGYYLLADWLELPNLSQQGRTFVRTLALKWFIEPKVELPSEPRLQTFIRLYGIAASLWMTTVMIGLFIAACNLFEGVGLLMGCTSIALWMVPNARGLLGHLYQYGRWQPRRVRRLMGTSLLTCGAVVAAGWLLPAPSQVVAPIVLEYDSQSELRAVAPGFVERISSRPYLPVQAGQLLVELSNPDLTAQLESLRADVAAAEIKIRIHHDKGEIAAELAEREQWSALSKQLGELEALTNQLKIIAPHDGQILSADLTEKQGTYLGNGDLILTLGVPESLQAVALVPQVYSDRLRELDAEDRPLTGRLYMDSGRIPVQSVTVTSVGPRASKNVPHLAFAAAFGGSLPVVQTTQSRHQSDSRRDSELYDRHATQQTSDWEFTDAHVKVTLRIESSESAAALRAGQTGTVSLSIRRESLGYYLVSTAARWLGRQFTRHHGF